ncbi:hypothetical protein [Lacticaseibacillus paracasei]|uniref:Uncharacterized protein n=1 Tax=Lacticaseibacillus paracasei (strain ATCC 334 / BCRC 17002 / CCUG 31169 / CIP 107868 / KCTC 3260 / NRRL B-441) TaxID=321967 RepID=Q036S3_LACP3|nr:hypothetical protein [Lacticaseibacillus paracasei]OFS07398.1 hypothetical protein HMPREF3095_01125 [Lactobacillus sp. HMSC25A02]ABJ70799.1 hypothetical protein LSEI_2044 [Lacticaseibacillus paracasei ATCC 334]KAB1965252.1 hypothetical protein F8272_09260 [Lacticaseibacillus paracasei]MCT3332782.1 hypothetical protein [Lacticaseibacillus paracasei]MCT3353862.1 hypothetical protein [Lacticaseibacillus paracasei]
MTNRRYLACGLVFYVLFLLENFRKPGLATRRFGVATAKLAHWARLQARKAPAVLKLGLGLGGENHATKTNFSAEPIAAPPALIILF